MTAYYSNHAKKYQTKHAARAASKRAPNFPISIIGRHLQPILFTLASLVILGELAYLAGWSHWAYLKSWETKAEQNNRLPISDITADIDTFMNGTHFGFIPNDNQLFFQRKALQSQLVADYPAIKSIALTRDFINRALIIDLRQRQEIALWCVADKLRVSQTCYFVDDEYIAFREAPQSRGVLLTHVTDYTGTPVHLGKRLVNGTLLGEILTAKTLLENNGVTAVSSRIDAIPDVVLHTAGGFDVLLDTEQSLERQVSNLNLAIQESLQSQDENIFDLDELEYVDLRIGNRIYFKKAGQSASTSTPQTGTINFDVEEE